MDLSALIPEQDSAQTARIASRADLALALDHLIAATRRELRVVHLDLEALHLADPARIAALRALLRSGPAARIRLLVDEPAWFETRAAGLKALATDYSHLMSVRVAAPEDRIGGAAWVIGDARHLIRLSPGAYPEGELLLNQPAATRGVLDEFSRHWDAAGHDLPSRPLGL